MFKGFKGIAGVILFLIIIILVSGCINEEFIIGKTGERDVCADSDNGRQYALKGRIVFTLDNAAFEYSDECIDSTQLKEYYCEERTLMSETVNCKELFGKTSSCKNGACITRMNIEDLNEFNS
ncbi:MAG: hypothetical protein ABH821_00285 [archaeon]